MEVGFGTAPGIMKFLRRDRRLDPDLFWVPDGYRGKLARLARRRPDIVFLGDSCTEIGDYPRRVIEGLRHRHPGRRILGEKLGATGWTSFQGLQLLRRDLAPLRPRIVTIYFGWNDHWLGFGYTDRQFHAMTTSLSESLRRLRLVQLLFKALLVHAESHRDGWPNRVPLERYRENLGEMVRIARASDSLPVLITAPSSHRQGSEPAHLALYWIRDLSQLVPLHRRYLEITREVARAEDALLCDLAADFDALLESQPAASYFQFDGIHLTDEGNQRVADLLIECLASTPATQAVWGAAQGR